MKKRLIIATLALAVSSTSAWAENDGASCGLGSTIMAGKDGRSAHTAASVIDVVASYVIGNWTTSSMTTGTMGCDPETLVQKEQEKNLFVAMNVQNLSRDMARGEGDYLRSVADLLNVKDLQAFARAAQQAFLQDLDSGKAVTSIQLLKQLDLARAQLG